MFDAGLHRSSRVDIPVFGIPGSGERSAYQWRQGVLSVGQETVARVHNLGWPPRRLVFLHLDGSGHTLPERGAEVEVDGRAVGRLTSVASHHELGPIALAIVKRNTPLDAACTVAGLSANQEEIVQRG